MAHLVAALVPGGMVLEEGGRDAFGLVIRRDPHVEKIEAAEVLHAEALAVVADVAELALVVYPGETRVTWDGTLKTLSRHRAHGSDHRPLWRATVAVFEVTRKGCTVAVALPID